MSIRKIVIALLAAAIIPFGLESEAAKPRKKTYHKSSVHKKKSSTTKKTKTNTVSITDAAAESVVENTTAQNEAIANSSDVSGETIVKTAMQYIGVPYRHGTSSPKSFDCSGFTSYVYKMYDISLSRSSRTQYTQGRVIKNKSDLRAGDLVFFQGRSGRGGVGHVGIVTEVSPSEKTFKFVHASSRGVGVDASTMAYYSSRYIGARRVLTTGEE